MMISNATNPLRESRKESLLRCVGSTYICEWLACDLVVICVQTVGDRALGDLCVCVRCGPFSVREYESVVIGLGTRVEVVSEEQKASLLDSRLCSFLSPASTQEDKAFLAHFCTVTTVKKTDTDTFCRCMVLNTS